MFLVTLDLSVIIIFTEHNYLLLNNVQFTIQLDVKIIMIVIVNNKDTELVLLILFRLDKLLVKCSNSVCKVGL